MDICNFQLSVGDSIKTAVMVLTIFGRTPTL